MSNALGRLTVLKSEAFISETGTDSDNVFKTLLLAASNYIQTYTARRLVAEQYKEQRYSGNDTNELLLREWPVIELKEVSIWDGTDSFDTESLGYFDLIPDENGHNNTLQYPKLGQESNATWGSWPDGSKNNIKITYDAGYNTTGWDDMPVTGTFDVPGDLEYACVQIAYKLWKDGSKGGGRFGMTSISKGADSFAIDRFIKGLPTDTLMILNKYRRLWL